MVPSSKRPCSNLRSSKYRSSRWTSSNSPVTLLIHLIVIDGCRAVSKSYFSEKVKGLLLLVHLLLRFLLLRKLLLGHLLLGTICYCVIIATIV